MFWSARGNFDDNKVKRCQDVKKREGGREEKPKRLGRVFASRWLCQVMRNVFETRGPG